MWKKIMLILAVIYFSFLGLELARSAQKYPNEEMDFSNFSQKFTQLDLKLDGLSRNLNKTNAELLKKLDQVLNNQEKIINELGIVKIRASKR